MGKGGDRVEKESSDGHNGKEVLIHGVFYDVSSLKHPGGSVIDFYAGKGIDATQAYENFHYRSARAQKFLQSLPSRIANSSELKQSRPLPGQDSLLNDFEELTTELIQEGFFKPSPIHAAYRISELIIMHIIGIYLMLHNSMPLGIIILAVAQGRCGWLMHEGGHNSFTGNISVDKYVQMIFYGVGCGMSGGWWRNQHNKHHSMPQKLGHDVDLNTLPLVAFSAKVIKRAGFVQRVWLLLQAYLFPLLTTLLVALGWQFYLHPRHIIRTKNYFEAVCLIVRYTLWSMILTSKFGIWNSALLYLVYDWIGANYIFLNFALSHTHLDTVPKDDTQVDWVRYAADYTINIESGPLKFVDWWMGFLNFQIEHHLYPSMPQFRQPLIAPRVKALFEKHGLEYKRMNYFSAMKVTFENLHKVGTEAFYG